jgi:hypothetical protein
VELHLLSVVLHPLRAYLGLTAPRPAESGRYRPSPVKPATPGAIVITGSPVVSATVAASLRPWRRRCTGAVAVGLDMPDGRRVDSAGLPAVKAGARAAPQREAEALMAAAVTGALGITPPSRIADAGPPASAYADRGFCTLGSEPRFRRPMKVKGLGGTNFGGAGVRAAGRAGLRSLRRGAGWRGAPGCHGFGPNLRSRYQPQGCGGGR